MILVEKDAALPLLSLLLLSLLLSPADAHFVMATDIRPRDGSLDDMMAVRPARAVRLCDGDKNGWMWMGVVCMPGDTDILGLVHTGNFGSFICKLR